MSFLLYQIRKGGRNLVGKKIKKIRETKGIRKAELARRSGVNKATLGFIENHKTTPTLRTLQKIAKGLEVDVIDLLQ